jgi:hypothetical protein
MTVSATVLFFYLSFKFYLYTLKCFTCVKKIQKNILFVNEVASIEFSAYSIKILNFCQLALIIPLRKLKCSVFVCVWDGKNSFFCPFRSDKNVLGWKQTFWNV